MKMLKSPTCTLLLCFMYELAIIFLLVINELIYRHLISYKLVVTSIRNGIIKFAPPHLE
jgi:hypothetical protein